MQTPLLFLSIDEGDIALILFYLLIHIVSLIFFIVSYASKGKIYMLSQVTLLIQFVMSVIVTASFFNLFSLVSLIASGAMVFILFRQKQARDKDSLQFDK